MKYSRQALPAFSLIELTVAITIFGIIMVSVMSIFLFSTQMTGRIELSRALQENIKNVTEDISENIRKEGIRGMRDFAAGSCTSPEGEDVFISTGLCVGEGVEYFLGNKNSSGEWVRVSDISECSDVLEDSQSICRVLKKQDGVFMPLTNNNTAIELLEFRLVNSGLPRVTLNIHTRPAYKKGLVSDIVQNSRLEIQTTFSQRLINME